MSKLKGCFINSWINTKFWQIYYRYTSRRYRVELDYFGSDLCGWSVNTEELNENSVIYSVGVGKDITFDLELFNKFQSKIYLFDPTPEVKDWINDQNLPDKIVFLDYGVFDRNGTIEFFPPQNENYISHSLIYSNNLNMAKAFTVPVKSLKNVIESFDHEYIDLLKLDIEGAEYKVLSTIITEKLPIKQILVEFHHRFSSFSFSETREALRSLIQCGYRIISTSKNGNQYTFLKTD